MIETIISTFFAFVSLCVIILFLPEIIGLGVVLLAAFYLVCFVGGYKGGLGR